MELLTWASDAPQSDETRDLGDVISIFVPMSVSGLAPHRRAESMTLVPMGDIVYCDCTWGPHQLSRPAQGVGETGEEYYALVAVHSGREIVCIDGERHVLAPGDVALWNCQLATQAEIPDHLHKSAILMPARILRQLSLGTGAQQALERFTDAPAAPLLRQMLGQIKQQGSMSHLPYRRLRNALVELFLATVESGREASDRGALAVAGHDVGVG